MDRESGPAGVTLSEAASIHIAERRALGYSELSLLRRLLEELAARATSRLSRDGREEKPSPVDLQAEDIHAVLDDVALARSRSTTRKAATILRSFGRWLFRRGLVLLDPARGVAVVKLERGLGYVPSPSDVARLLAEAEPGKVLLREGLTAPPLKARRRSWAAFYGRRALLFAEALRDAALLELLYGSGLRIAEATALTVSDLDLSERVVFVRSGKGAKQRHVPLTKETVKVLRRYLAEDGRDVLARGRFVRKETRRRAPSRVLFLSTTGGPLPEQTWRERRLVPLVRAAGLPKALLPHRLRHACAVHLLERGADILFIARLLGHERLETTAVYLSLTTTELERALLRHPREAD